MTLHPQYRTPLAVTVLAVGFLIWSIRDSGESHEMLRKSAQKINESEFLVRALAAEKAKVASLYRELETVKHDAEHRSDTGEKLDGIFDVSSYKNPDGITNSVVFLTGRTHLQLPGGFFIFRFSDSEWSWMTNSLHNFLVPGSSAQGFVFTDQNNNATNH